MFWEPGSFALVRSRSLDIPLSSADLTITSDLIWSMIQHIAAVFSARMVVAGRRVSRGRVKENVYLSAVSEANLDSEYDRSRAAGSGVMLNKSDICRGRGNAAHPR